MRIKDFLLLALVAVLLSSCDASTAPKGPGRTDPSVSSTDCKNQGRGLQNIGGMVSGTFSAVNEDRGAIPYSVKAARKGTRTKESHAADTLDVLDDFDPIFLGKIKEFWDRAKHRVSAYLRDQSWNIRFTIWLKNKVTPAKMYDRLKVRETSGPYDKNYRLYIAYLIVFERIYGPTDNPLHVFGPKLKPP